MKNLNIFYMKIPDSIMTVSATVNTTTTSITFTQ